jgi:hypothetical protein
MNNQPGATAMASQPTSVADSVPSAGLDFGYCGIQQTATRTFTLQNPSGQIVRFEILIDNCPFLISPMSGTLNSFKDGYSIYYRGPRL